ncbi:hypothetical protein DQ244_10220 [Blastococcus sp. TBT05-19]|uniref:hypothetical protein n=1 Tax=Blastococcus sp. TBT05-19 TaxID=2250581 RepID=UPI000DE8CB57|nr:hypothetical protein [Blastococcus sp. TBT05-19]RBY91669.1 hypothetical protein DQ244_10220 [Blastococcus sp. TBT05-19]
MADYSEFPTTPTAWQEQQWEEVKALATEDRPEPAPARRAVDLVALVPGLLFVLLAVAAMAGVDLRLEFLADGGFIWIAVVAAGVLLLGKELRRSRRTR